jgi:hypothetical protein
MKETKKKKTEKKIILLSEPSEDLLDAVYAERSPKRRNDGRKGRKAERMVKWWWIKKKFEEWGTSEGIIIWRRKKNWEI